jgi:hypothetical protein
MKQYILVKLVLISIFLVCALVLSKKHICKDTTHQKCDGYCICDGLNCQ